MNREREVLVMDVNELFEKTKDIKLVDVTDEVSKKETKETDKKE